jgi:16S rRNA G966 N2-methylase RsmD
VPLSAYLTKVPISAIEPFLKAFTSPGDVVLDMYGGSGMTGVAAAMHGRRAEVRDISALGRHIGSNYMNLVNAVEFRAQAREVMNAAKARLGDLYAVKCGCCSGVATLSRTVWTFVYECGQCHAPVNYYEVLQAAGWKKNATKCAACDEPFLTRGSRRIEETPMLDTVACDCSPRLRDYEHLHPLHLVPDDAPIWPGVSIGESRQMFQSSALRKHGLLTTDAFFSKRNLAVLSTLREAIDRIKPESIRSKLLFAFTAILSRASKRYQWHPKRPLNAANQNYYVAPVFYEWNVYDLFERKVEAAVRSDAYLRGRMDELGVSEPGSFNYAIGSADNLDLEDESVDYIFTDPPFGSNIFYSDMNLFQEAWLGTFTDDTREAVVDRSRGKKSRGAERYEDLIVGSLREAARLLRPDGWLSIVFSNSNGEMWALMQRAIRKAGFSLGEVTLLSKGQRSVKGLASGFENVVTADLVLSLRKNDEAVSGEPVTAPRESVSEMVDAALRAGVAPTPSHLYLRIIRRYLQRDWDLSDLHISDIVQAIELSDFDVDVVSGRLIESDVA